MGDCVHRRGEVGVGVGGSIAALLATVHCIRCHRTPHGPMSFCAAARAPVHCLSTRWSARTNPRGCGGSAPSSAAAPDARNPCRAATSVCSTWVCSTRKLSTIALPSAKRALSLKISWKTPCLQVLSTKKGTTYWTTAAGSHGANIAGMEVMLPV